MASIQRLRQCASLLGKSHGLVRMFSTSCAEGCLSDKPDIDRIASAADGPDWVSRPTESALDSLRHSRDWQLASRYRSPIGQPTCSTHPHLIEPNELTSGLTKTEYQSRRRKLASLVRSKSVASDDLHHVVFVSAATTRMMSNDIPYPFRQDSNFLYLTGLLEPDAVLMLEIDAQNNTDRSTLFVKPKDPARELWDGPLSGLAAAVNHFGADEAFPLASFHKVVTDKWSAKGGRRPCVWYDRLPPTLSSGFVDETIKTLTDGGTFSSTHMRRLQPLIEPLRLIKSKAEIKLMTRACSIVSNAFARAMRSTKSGLEESILHVVIEYECHLQGAQRLSFPPVVAGGDSANTLHYISNSQILKDGDMVLVDAGCEFNGYSSDVSRTWPVNGKFTQEQRLLYDLVLSVQKTCIEAAKVGTTLNALHTLMLRDLGEKMKSLGLISSNLTAASLQHIAASFCPHHVGHYLGMDTHDTGSISRQLPLQDGMIITVEPGLYIAADEQRVPVRYRGVGIRIEDNILVTKDGPVVLTTHCPKTAAEIEETMQLL